MRSALAKGLGVKEEAVTIDYGAKQATVEMGDGSADAEALATAMKETNQYTATPVN